MYKIEIKALLSTKKGKSVIFSKTWENAVRHDCPFVFQYTEQKPSGRTITILTVPSPGSWFDEFEICTLPECFLSLHVPIDGVRTTKNSTFISIDSIKVQRKDKPEVYLENFEEKLLKALKDDGWKEC